MERRKPDQGILCALSWIDRRDLWRLPQFRSFSPLRLLRAGHHSKVLPDRPLGINPARIRRDETGALFVHRQRDGVDRPDRGLRRRRWPHLSSGRSWRNSRSRAFQKWAFLLVFVGFAILAGLWPFHTWAPTGHVAAPTAASMLLAGVVMKLGAYGALRVAMTLFPIGLQPGARTIAVLAVIGIVYGATGGAGATGLQIRHRLLQRQPHGLCLAGLDDLTQSESAARCCKCSLTASSPACSSRWWAGWFMTAPIAGI